MDLQLWGISANIKIILGLLATYSYPKTDTSCQNQIAKYINVVFQKIDFHVVPYTCDNVGGQGITAYCISKPQIELKKKDKIKSDSLKKSIIN